MKVKSSRGIVVKLICCMALVVIASAVAFSQTPKSGALLTITSNDATPVILKIYDSQIHTGTVRTPAGNGSCSALAGSDDIPTDAYVLQGGSPTGCDANDPFETASTQIGSATLSGGGYSFSVTAAYCNTAPSGTEISCTTVGPGNGCNSAGTICANPDTGFLTIKNTGATAFVGTISLTGTSPLCGAASDTASGLGAGASVTLALGSPGLIDSSNCGGFNQPQTLTLTANQESKASFGKDDYVIKPLNSAAGAKLDVLPVPVPAGPTGSETNPAASSLYFSPGATFSNLKCIPYADFSALNNPVCVELQLTPNDAGNYLYTATNDFNIDKHSLAGGIGGPSFLGHHLNNCPDSGFDINIFFTYTAPDVTNGDPLKGGGSGTGSCWVTAFDPNAGAISTGTIFSSFVGFQLPVSDSDENLYKPGSSIPLIWQMFSSPGVPVTTLSLCPGMTVPSSNVCPTSGVSTPWVWVGTARAACIVDNSPNADLLTDPTVAAGASSLQNSGNGTYQYNLKTQKPALSTCFNAVLIFDTGLTVFPANFKAKN